MTVDFKNLDIMTNALNLDTWSRPNLSVNPFKCVSIFANSNVKALKLLNLDTSSVTDMSSMFRFCGVNELDLSNFDTHNVTDMDSMFAGCSASSLDLRSFNTRKVKRMKSMFACCDSLKELDLSSFIIQQDTITSGMFIGCKELDILILPVDPYSRMRIEKEIDHVGIKCCTH